MLQTPENALKDLKEKKYTPVYFLHGEESYFIDLVSDFIEENVLPASEKGFNLSVLYAKDVGMADVLSQARRYPMMAERQVVIVKELQQMNDWNKENANKIFEAYLNNPQASTLLVLNHKHKSFNKNTSLYKLIEKKAVVVEAKKIYENQVFDWIINFIKKKGYQIENKAAQLLTEAIGADLGKLNSEVNKLLLNISPDKSITVQLVEENVGISKDYNVFELQKALSAKNGTKIFQIIRYWEANPKKQPLIPTLVLLFGFFTKLLLASQEKDKSHNNLAKVMGINPYVIEDYKIALQNYAFDKLVEIISHLRTADLQVKGIKAGGNSEAEILKELVFRILN